MKHRVSFFNFLQNIIKITLNIALGVKIICLHPYVVKVLCHAIEYDNDNFKRKYKSTCTAGL